MFFPSEMNFRVPRSLLWATNLLKMTGGARKISLRSTMGEIMSKFLALKVYVKGFHTDHCLVWLSSYFHTESLPFEQEMVFFSKSSVFQYFQYISVFY